MNLGTKTDARRVLAEMATAAASSAAKLSDLRARLKTWREVLGGARAMAERIVLDPGRVDSTQDVATRELMPLHEALAAKVPVDYSSSTQALASFARAIKVRDTLSKAVTDMETEVGDHLRRLKAVEDLIVAAGTLSREEAQVVSNEVFESKKVALRGRDADSPPAAQPIVDIMAFVLGKHGKPLSSTDLIKMLAEAGRPVTGRNPWGAVRSAVSARKDAPVVSVGRGLWGLREWQRPNEAPKASSARRRKG